MPAVASASSAGTILFASMLVSEDNKCGQYAS
jgi:hypothetical protein